MTRVCLYCARFESEPLTVTPLGIGYLASYLVHSGVVRGEDVRIVDSLEEALAFKPDILGVGSVSQVVRDAARLARECKRAAGCLTVLGGYHVTCAPHSLPPEFDIAVLGEGELTFAEIVARRREGTLGRDELGDVRGICYRDDRGEVVLTAPREQIVDIDSLPYPRRHKQYSRDEPIFTSRGCPFRCTYCASHTFWGDRYRLRTARSVVEEITRLVDTRDPREIVILDDLWMSDKKRFREIVEELAERGIPERVTFRGFCRSNLVHEEDILLFKKLNYRFIRFGAETGSQRLLQRIKGANITIDDHQRVIDLAFKHGIECGASFMFGVPGETENDLRLTMKFLRKNKDKCRIMGFYLFNPIPGTPIWSELLADGTITEELDLARLQLDFLKPSFSWDNLLYFNENNVPIKKFRKIVEGIRRKFIDAPPTGRTRSGSMIKRLMGRFK